MNSRKRKANAWKDFVESMRFLFRPGWFSATARKKYLTAPLSECKTGVPAPKGLKCFQLLLSWLGTGRLREGESGPISGFRTGDEIQRGVGFTPRSRAGKNRMPRTKAKVAST